MKLSFYARGDKLVLYPGLQTPNGQLPHYIGRESVRGTKTERGGFPAVQEAFECQSESPVGQRLSRLMRVDSIDPPLYCANAETAAFCGVPFVNLSFGAGAWSEFTPQPAVQEQPQESEARRVSRRS